MPKIKYPEHIQKLKEQLETGNNLVDYFFICGISPSLCTNELLYKVTSEDINSEALKDIFQPKILCKFPDFDKTNVTIDEGIIAYCFPDGFNIEYNDKSYPAPKYFSIVLDNSMLSQDNPQKYLICALIYESVHKYKKLKQYIENIESNKEDNGQENKIINNINNIRNDLEEEKNTNVYRHKKMITNIIPSMDIECLKMDKQDLNEINKDNHINLQKNIENKNKLEHYYIPKCICLVSTHPNVKLYQKILSNIIEYGLSQNNDIEIPLEKIITNLIIEVPVPPRGLYSIHYDYNFDFSKKNNEIINESANKDETSVPPLKSTENNKLLLSDIDLSKFNKSLSFNCKMETLEHILLGTKILFFSLNLTTIIDTISAFMSLIFPFKYPFQILSCLHKNNYGILESPSIFIIGIKEKFDENFFKINDIHLEFQNFFVVDLDSKEEKNYYLFTEEEFPKFPSKLLSNLEKEIKSLENSKIKTIKEFNENYQEKFFKFLCEILRGYEDFLNRNFFNEDFVDLSTLFNCEKFIKCIYHSQADYPFYTKFIEESQLFLEFILKNMTPKNNNELMDILFVSNYLNSQKKKKNKNNEQNDYTITNKYIVPRPKEITKEEKDQIIKDRISLIKKGQIIKTSKFEDENIIKFDYFLFPELDFNIYCNNDNVNQYISPPDYREEIEALNMEAISKSSLGKNINRAMEMKNYLYLTWLEIWAFTFGNNDLKERHYRFDQMLDVLDKVIHHEMNILNLMFNMLNEFKENEMLLKLYQKILQLKIMPSTLIFDIMKTIIDKKNMLNILDETKKTDKKLKLKSLKFNDYNKMNNRERTFLSINDNLPLETKPKFYFDYDCINIDCDAKINLYSISKNFEGVKNDILWVPCSKCKEFILPKITVKFGLNFINSQSKSTSIEEYVLHSPYNLKTNIKQAFNTQLRNESQNEKFKLKISNFKTQFQTLFWDFIWYCIIHDLDYNILLPYSKNLEEEKKSHYINPNIKIFEVSYDDSSFVANQNKIEKISSNIIKLNSGEKKKKIRFKKLKKCSGVIRLEIKDKKINVILNSEIIEEKDDINEISEEDNKDSKDSKENKEKSNEKQNKENEKLKTKKSSMFDFFFNVKEKINQTKNEIKPDNKENNKIKEEKDKPKKNDDDEKKGKKDDFNDVGLLGEEYIDD